MGSHKLTEEQIVTAYAKVERANLEVLKHSQHMLRTEVASGLQDALRPADAASVQPLTTDSGNGRGAFAESLLCKRPRTGADVGHPITILPASFTGSPRYMRARYLDAMALLKEYKHPDLFVTFTASPKCDSGCQHAVVTGLLPGLTQAVTDILCCTTAMPLAPHTLFKRYTLSKLIPTWRYLSILFFWPRRWPEIVAELQRLNFRHMRNPKLQSAKPRHFVAKDRPDLVARSFHLRLQQLLKELMHDGVLGPVAAHVYVIEFQKRGLPHAHILLWFTDTCRMRCPADYDSVVRAEIPDPSTQPELHELVVEHMLHHPCHEKGGWSCCENAHGR
jgi:hypothetical protein